MIVVIILIVINNLATNGREFMNILRKSLAVLFVILAILSLAAMAIQGFQLVRLLAVLAWLVTAAALSAIGGKPVRIIGYITSAAIIGLFGMSMQIAFTLEPGSNDAFGAFIVASAGILLGSLAAWGIYSTTNKQPAASQSAAPE